MNNRTVDEEKKQRKKAALINFLIGLVIALVVIAAVLILHPGGYGLMEVSLEIRCDSLLAEASSSTHSDPSTPDSPPGIADPDLLKKLPPNGVILSKKTFNLDAGKTALDLLLEAAKEEGIDLEIEKSEDGQSLYIKGIQGIMADPSQGKGGWTYSLNGENPSYSPDLCHLQEGDEIIFYYSRMD